MTKQQITRLSTIERMIINSRQKKAVEVIFLSAKQYNDMKLQLDKPFSSNGLKRLIFSDGETIAISEQTVVLVDDL